MLGLSNGFQPTSELYKATSGYVLRKRKNK
jgi:hypothetical protein